MPGWELIGSEEKKILIKSFLSQMVLCLLMASRISEIIIILYENLKKSKKKLGVKYCLATTSGTMAQYIMKAFRNKIR